MDERWAADEADGAHPASQELAGAFVSATRHPIADAPGLSFGASQPAIDWVKVMARMGEEVSLCAPRVRRRHPAHSRLPPGAGFFRTGGSQADEGHKGFVHVKSVPDTPRRAARSTRRLARAGGPRTGASSCRGCFGGCCAVAKQPAVPRRAQGRTPSTARHPSNACGSVVGRPVLPSARPS